MSINLSNPVKYLRGVGPHRAAALEERGIVTVGDLLGYLPFRYEDRIRFTKIAQIIPGQVQTILAEVASGGGSTVRFRGGRGPVFHVMVRDASGSLHARFFHGAYLEGRLKEGQRLVMHGKAEVDAYRPGRIEMVNPQIEILSGDGAPADSTEVGRIVPVYEAIGAISSRMLRRIIYSVLLNFDGNIPDPLPEEIRARYRFPGRREALLAVHFPEKNENVELLNTFRSPAHLRLIFEEFFYYQIALALRRSQDHRQRGIAMRVREEKVREALKRILPFKPTVAQKRVLAEIASDLEKPFPMHRLLEGDVGSGKTIVALEAATIAIENGYQVALMAPTEILAAQHFLSARRVFARGGYRVDLVVSGRKRAEREEALARIESGETKLVVGTHALIEDPVKFHKLGLAIVDEQHRFGVLQRKRLIEKGASPHVLVMTATPIPRTLALTLYGDLELSVIDEMPPGRTPIETRWTADAQLPGVWEFLRREIAKGRQAYVLYPVIEESKQELKAATAEYERLAKNVFAKLRVGLLHGRLKNDDKDSVMEQF
ncbi:MAG: ATP-dependent DNA helicase RecG, partial [Candidatus Acidiferrales bacterium]